MESKKCYVCGKTPLSKDEIGLTKKIIDKNATVFYCLPCLAEYLEVTEEELIAKIDVNVNEYLGHVLAKMRASCAGEHLSQ